jgi:Dynamin family
MADMMKNGMAAEVQNLIAVTSTLLNIIQNDEDIYQNIEESRRKFENQQAPSVQLYGVSQAGKSTLISCLTLGEQYIPIGTGKATTAVKVELLNVDSPKQHRAEIDWFSPEELLRLVEQPLDFYIKLLRSENSYQSPFSLSGKNKDFRSYQSSLTSREDRDFLWDVLQAAKRDREDDTGKLIVGGGNDLAIAEVILRHYEEYATLSSPDGHTLHDLSQLPDWTRQPHEWGNWEKRAISEYSFDELRSFFTNKVRLYVTTPKVAADLRLIDTPGFGVSNLHDEICRNTQKEAEAIVLVLGTQFTTDQLREIKQLTLGLCDNLFVIWNPKVETKEHSEDMLGDMLTKLKEETGITVPKSRAVVANLHLALRAMQYEKITRNSNFSKSTELSLHEMFSRKYSKKYSQDVEGLRKYVSYELRKTLEQFVYPGDEVERDDEDRIADSLSMSGWKDILKMLDDIVEAQKQRRNKEFALVLLRAMISYLERFPTPREKKKREETLHVLKSMLVSIEQQRGLIKESMEKK